MPDNAEPAKSLEQPVRDTNSDLEGAQNEEFELLQQIEKLRQDNEDNARNTERLADMVKDGQSDLETSQMARVELSTERNKLQAEVEDLVRINTDEAAKAERLANLVQTSHNELETCQASEMQATEERNILQVQVEQLIATNTTQATKISKLQSVIRSDHDILERSQSEEIELAQSKMHAVEELQRVRAMSLQKDAQIVELTSKRDKIKLVCVGMQHELETAQRECLELRLANKKLTSTVKKMKRAAAITQDIAVEDLDKTQLVERIAALQAVAEDSQEKLSGTQQKLMEALAKNQEYEKVGCFRVC